MRSALALAAAAIATPALAQPFACTVDSAASLIDASVGVGLTSSGTLIGDFDPVTNPGGTQTRPGLFGGSGNNPIPLNLTGTASSSFMLSPAGSFGLDLDTSGLAFEVSGLAADLLNGQTVAATLSATISFSSFNTINPTFIYPGGTPITVPLDDANINVLSLSQSGPMTLGVLVPVDADTFTLAGTLPATLTFGGDFLGQPIPPSPVDLPLPITGMVDINGDGTITATLELDLDGTPQSIDVSALPPIENVPFGLPTFGTATANVLLTLNISALDVTAGGSVTLVATGVSAGGCNIADLAQPFGTLNIDDVLAFLNAFAAQDPAADVAAPTGAWNIDDVLVFLNAFADGCP